MAAILKAMSVSGGILLLVVVVVVIVTIAVVNRGTAAMNEGSKHDAERRH